MRHEKTGGLLKLARLLASSAEGMTLDEMAAETGKSRRSVERMRDALEELFPTLQAEPDGLTKRFRIRGGLDAFFQAPTAEELVELKTAEKSLRQAGHQARADALAELDRKVRSAIRKGSARIETDLDALARTELVSVRAGPKPFEDKQTLDRIREAVKSMRAVRFRYRGGSRSGELRVVVPYGLLFERMNYLVGPEHGFPKPFTWRLDRITELEVTEINAPIPDDFSLMSYANQSFGIFNEGAENVVLRVLPEGVEDARSWRFHANQTIVDDPDGTVTIRFRSSGMRELAWHLFTWADRIVIIEPARLKSEMLEMLEACLHHHRANGGPLHKALNPLEAR